MGEDALTGHQHLEKAKLTPEVIGDDTFTRKTMLML